MTTVIETARRVEDSARAMAEAYDRGNVFLRDTNARCKDIKVKKRQRVLELLVDRYGWRKGGDECGPYIAHPDFEERLLMAGLTRQATEKKDDFEKRFQRASKRGKVPIREPDWKELQAVFFRIAAINPYFKPRILR